MRGFVEDSNVCLKPAWQITGRLTSKFRDGIVQVIRVISTVRSIVKGIRIGVMIIMTLSITDFFPME